MNKHNSLKNVTIWKCLNSFSDFEILAYKSLFLFMKYCHYCGIYRYILVFHKMLISLLSKQMCFFNLLRLFVIVSKSIFQKIRIFALIKKHNSVFHIQALIDLNSFLLNFKLNEFITGYEVIFEAIMFQISRRTLSYTSAFFSLYHALSIHIVRGTDNGNNGLFSKINILVSN